MPDLPEVRSPYPSEIDWFRNDPKGQKTPGMATEDNRVILNPFFKFESERAKQSVLMNETARAFMRANDFRPDFYVSQSQMGQFRDYSNDIRDIRETIAARALSGDPSAGQMTREQKAFIERLRQAMFGK